MTKARVTKIFLAGVLAAIAGAIVATGAGAVAYTSNVFVMNGEEVVGLRASPLTWTLLSVGIVGAITMAAGAIAGLISWIGGMVRRAAPARDLQLRDLRNDRLHHRRTRRHGKGGAPLGACTGQSVTSHLRIAPAEAGPCARCTGSDRQRTALRDE